MLLSLVRKGTVEHINFNGSGHTLNYIDANITVTDSNS